MVHVTTRCHNLRDDKIIVEDFNARTEKRHVSEVV
jgi:hypothetical protein